MPAPKLEADVPPSRSLLRDSPTSILAGCCLPRGEAFAASSALYGAWGDAETAAVVHCAARMLWRAYLEALRSGWLDVAFHRGKRRITSGAPAGAQTGVVVFECVETHAVRRLSTQMLCWPSTDSWGIFIGALDLARVYAINKQTIYRRGEDSLDRATRLRLAACFTVSWKFNRCRQGLFPNPFSDDEGNAHSLELALMGSLFLTPTELQALGAFPTNVSKWEGLQSHMIELEVGLVVGVATFPSLAENALSVAERELEALLERRIPGIQTWRQLLIVRSLLPFFVRVSLVPSAAIYASAAGDAHCFAKALIGCALIALNRADRRTFELVDALFDAKVHTLLCELVAAAADVAQADPDPNLANLDPWFGCYGESQHWNVAATVTRERVIEMHRALLNA
jgi:hypothetical protein